MEVVSVREPLSSTSTQIEQPDLVQELPPPPEPFPVQILDELDQSDALKVKRLSWHMDCMLNPL